MITAALVLAGLTWQTPQAPETATYNNFVLNLAFSYPKSWSVSTNNKKETTKMTIPLGGSTKATVEIFDAIYGAEPDAWQKVQIDINKQLGREIVRQWQEEILGVPMLFTKVHYYDKGVDTQALTGLLYNRSYKKLLLRMVAPTGSYDAVELDLRNALQSLRTLNGSTLKPETPNRPVLPEETKPDINPGVVKVTYLKPTSAKERIRKGEQVEKLVTGGKSVEFHYAGGWTLNKRDGGYELKNPQVKGAVFVTVNSVLDSDAPTTALLKASGKSLDSFNSVSDRRESPIAPSRAGASMTSIWRVGASAAGPATSCEATGSIGDYYWLLTYQSVPDPVSRRLVDELIQSMSVDLVP